MELHIVGTGSKGNCYLLESEKEILMIECGVKPATIKQALNFNVNKVVGCILSHEHNDHSKSMHEITTWGIEVYASEGTLKSKKMIESNRANIIKKNKAFTIGEFQIIPFDVKHDAAEPMGFLINHPECGKTLFLTDTFYVEYLFKGLNNIIIEANYSKEIIDEKLSQNNGFLRDRVVRSHFSLENCCELLDVNDLSAVNNIVLIHLSDSNSDEVKFKETVQNLTNKNVSVAHNGMKIQFNKTPF